MSKDTGGPAFPLAVDFDNKVTWHTGMTLRDCFAAKAMQGELASMRDLECGGLALDVSDETLDRLTRHYYRIADAMLKARSQ